MMSPEEFDNLVNETLNALLVNMAEHPEVDPQKFYSMACMLENLAFFSPVIYGAIQPQQKPE